MMNEIDYEGKYIRKHCAHFELNEMFYKVQEPSYTTLYEMELNNQIESMNFLNKLSYLIKVSEIIMMLNTFKITYCGMYASQVIFVQKNYQKDYYPYPLHSKLRLEMVNLANMN